MTEGKITPEVSKRWEDGCIDYFECKEIAEDKQVRKVLAGLRDQRVCDWFSINRAHIQALTFPNFMKEFRIAFLDEDWEGKCCCELLTMTQGRDAFKDYLCRLQTKNALLMNMTSHLDESKLRHQLEAGLEEVLDVRVKLLKSNKIVPFKDWTDEVKHIDKLISAERGDMQRMLNQNHDSRCNNSALADPSRHANTGNSSSSNTAVVKDFPPKLTKKGKQLLHDNKGCFRCRKFFVDHQSKNCEKDFPSGVNYKEHRQTDVDAAKAKKSKSSDKKPYTLKAVTAVIGSSSRRVSSVCGRSHSRSVSHHSHSRSPRHSTSPAGVL